MEDFYKIDGGLNNILEKNIALAQHPITPTIEQQILQPTPSTTTT